MITMSWIKSHINQIFSAALALIIIFIAIRQGQELINALKQVRFSWAFLGLACYGVNYLLRALRFSMFLRHRIRMWPDAFHAACLHGLATYLLPFRSGDFTLPMILNKTSDLPIKDGAGVLISVRMLDMCALGLWILTAAALVEMPLPEMVHGAWILFGVFLLLMPLILKWAIGFGRPFEGRFLQRLLSWGRGVTNFDIPSFCVSFGIWACVGACFFCTAKAIRLPLEFMDMWLLITIQLPLQLIPLQGIANAGNHEGGWVAGLTLMGIPSEQGLHFALLSHALLVIYVLVLGPLAFFINSSPVRQDICHK